MDGVCVTDGVCVRDGVCVTDGVCVVLGVMDGVLLGTSLRIANPRSVKEALQTTGSQRIVYCATALSVLFIDLIWGVMIGILVDYLASRIEKRKKVK